MAGHCHIDEESAVLEPIHRVSERLKPLIFRYTGSAHSAALSSKTPQRDNAGKIERWHQTLKNRILLENYYLPGDLEAQIGRFIEYHNHQRYHESLDNLTPADVYIGRGRAILQERHRIKQKTIEHRRLLHRKLAA